jgi:hypothetical protein
MSKKSNKYIIGAAGIAALGLGGAAYMYNKNKTYASHSDMLDNEPFNDFLLKKYEDFLGVYKNETCFIYNYNKSEDNCLTELKTKLDEKFDLTCNTKNVDYKLLMDKENLIDDPSNKKLKNILRKVAYDGQFNDNKINPIFNDFIILYFSLDAINGNPDNINTILNNQMQNANSLIEYLNKYKRDFIILLDFSKYIKDMQQEDNIGDLKGDRIPLKNFENEGELTGYIKTDIYPEFEKFFKRKYKKEVFTTMYNSILKLGENIIDSKCFGILGNKLFGKTLLKRKSKKKVKRKSNRKSKRKSNRKSKRKSKRKSERKLERKLKRTNLRKHNQLPMLFST